METPRRAIKAWAVTLARSDAPSAAVLRTWPNVSAAAVDDELWLRGEDFSDELASLLRRVAPKAWFTVDETRQLTPVGRTLPVATLPDAHWVPLAEVLRVVVGRTSLPASATMARAALRLVRSDVERLSNAAVIAIDALAAWCSVAPSVRLDRLRFAASADSYALVLGEPLPPVPSRPCYERGGVVVPCGFMLQPTIDSASLRKRLGLEADDVALFDENGWHLIPGPAIVPLTRSAVRMTLAGLNHEFTA